MDLYILSLVLTFLVEEKMLHESVLHISNVLKDAVCIVGFKVFWPRLNQVLSMLSFILFYFLFSIFISIKPGTQRTLFIVFI